MEIVLSIIILCMGVALVLSIAIGVAKSWAIEDITNKVLEQQIKEKTSTKEEDEILENW